MRTLRNSLRLSLKKPVPIKIFSARGEEADFHLDLLKIAADANECGYNELTQSWRSLETKAQGTAGIAGIFLAGAFAFAKDIPAALPDSAAWCLALATVFLVASACFALVAQRIRLMPTAPTTIKMDSWIRDIRNAPGPADPDVLIRLYEEANKHWAKTNNELLLIINRKARWLRISQSLLLCAGLIVVLVTIVSITAQRPFNRGGSHATVSQVPR